MMFLTCYQHLYNWRLMRLISLLLYSNVRSPVWSNTGDNLTFHIPSADNKGVVKVCVVLPDGSCHGNATITYRSSPSCTKFTPNTSWIRYDRFDWRYYIPNTNLQNFVDKGFLRTRHNWINFFPRIIEWNMISQDLMKHVWQKTMFWPTKKKTPKIKSIIFRTYHTADLESISVIEEMRKRPFYWFSICCNGANTSLFFSLWLLILFQMWKG